jgi:uroporphyrinogen decarboxylase
VPFQPDYRHIVDVLRNRRPTRLPIYEHLINPGIMEKILGVEFAGFLEGGRAEAQSFFSPYCRFFKEMTYDTVSFEVCITEILPGHGAIMGGRPGPIQNRADFDRYPWEELPERYFRLAGPQFEALAACLPAGMKAVGGVGNGAFEISEDLVGFQYLAYLMVDDPPLFADLYRRIGDVMSKIWTVFLERYAEPYAVCRMGDDLGFKTGVLLAPATIREFVLPQYRRIIDLVHKSGRPFLWHSCGNIFSVMDDVIALGIDAKHSNEDIIAPFDEWIARYGGRIGLLGGIDVDVLCCRSPEDVYRDVLDKGRRFRSRAKGYALGSGNSIPDYVPVESYLAMIRAAQEIRMKPSD